MNIKKLVKLNFLIIIFLVVSIFLINSIVLEKLKENQYSKKEISKLVFMQENMNFLVKDIIDTENLKELEELKNEFLIYEKKFEKIKNYLFIKDKDDFLDLLIKDIHKHPNVEKHLILLSKSEKDIEKYFDNIFEMQKRKIELKTLFLQDYPKESLLRKNIEKEILQTKDLNIIKHFSDIKYYSKEVLFQHKEDKYLNILLEKIYSLQKIYPNNQLSEYIDIINYLCPCFRVRKNRKRRKTITKQYL